MKILKSIRIFSAFVFLLLTLCAPVAKNYHVIAHDDADNSVAASIGESCPLCDFDFSVFEENSPAELPSVSVKKYVLYVPLKAENFFKAFENVFVIRGPPCGF